MTNCFRAAKSGTPHVCVIMLKQGLSVVINVMKYCLPVEMTLWEASSNPSENSWRFSLRAAGKQRPCVCCKKLREPRCRDFLMKNQHFSEINQLRNARWAPIMLDKFVPADEQQCLQFNFSQRMISGFNCTNRRREKKEGNS